MRKDKLNVLFIAIITGAVIGGLLGSILAHILPLGVVKTLFQKSVTVGFDPVRVNLYIISLTFGLKLYINFLSAIGIFIAIYYFKWWYL